MTAARRRAEAVHAAIGRTLEALVGDRLSEPACSARVLDLLLDRLAEEYGEAVDGGRVTDMEEYRDASGMLRAAEALWRRVAASAPGKTVCDETDGIPAELAKGLAAPVPPAEAASPAKVRALVSRVRLALSDLRRAIGGRWRPPAPRDAHAWPMRIPVTKTRKPPTTTW